MEEKEEKISIRCSGGDNEDERKYPMEKEGRNRGVLGFVGIRRAEDRISKPAERGLHLTGNETGKGEDTFFGYFLFD